MKLIDILYENTQANEKFVNYLLPKLTEFFKNLYKDTDWMNAAYNVMYTNKDPYEYRAAGMNANIQIEELKKFLSSTKNVLTTDVSQLLEIRKGLLERTKAIDKNMYLLIHLRELFNSMSQGNFMDNYSVTPGIMIEVWERWKKEVYEPEAKQRELNYGGQQLIPISSGDFMGSSTPKWEKYNPVFGQQDFWKTFFTPGMGATTYVTSSYLENDRGNEPLMFVARDNEMVYSFIDNVEMEMAIDELSPYFTSVGARKVINFIRKQPSWPYDDEDIDSVEEEIGLDIKNYVDEHPEIDFNTDGDTDETFTYIGQILNDYLHY